MAGLLLENGADFRSKSRSIFREAACHYAVLLGHMAVAKLLVERGADIKVADRAAMVAAQQAVTAGHGETVSLLFDFGRTKMDLNLCVHSICNCIGLKVEMIIIERDMRILFSNEEYSCKFLALGHM